MSNVNYSMLSVLTSDEVILVSGIFSDEQRAYGGAPKEYTFKTTRKDLLKDDLCIVQCAGQSASYGFSVIKITKVDVPLDVSVAHGFKWVVDKLELEEFNEKLEAEAALIAQVKSAQKVTKKQQLLAALGIADVNTPLKLSDFRSHGFKGQ